MRSERRIVASTLLLAAALLALASCRGIYRPKDPEPPQGSFALVVDVIPPPGVDLHGLTIDHDNALWVGFGDSLRRRESLSLDAAGRLVFEGLLPGPTLIDYFWSADGGHNHSGTWGVVQIPSPPLEVDFSRPNTTIRSRWTIDGETLEHSRLTVTLGTRIESDLLIDRFYTPADSLGLLQIPGSWKLEARWEFPRPSRLQSAMGSFADSLVVPGSWDLGPEFPRVWIQPWLGGAPLRNAELRATLWIPFGGIYRDFYLSYRSQALDGDPLPFALAGSVFELALDPVSPGLDFPSRRWWLEAAPGDTLRVELGENRVRLRLLEGEEPAPFLAVEFSPQRLDTGEVTVSTDEQGRATLWLPDGIYELGLGSAPLMLAGSEFVEIVSDTLLTLEVQRP